MDASNGPAGAVLDLTLLRSFLEVIDCGGFALAADRLALTPSAVSGHIKRLESAVGATLLDRTTRSFELTSAGETLYTYARNIVELEREARARLSGARLKGRLRVGSSEDFAGAWLAEVLQAFHRTHPAASIELKVGITADLLRHQARGKLDVVFGKQCARVPDDGELLWEEELVWAWGDDKPWRQVPQVPLAVFPEPCVYREAAIAALAQAGRAWRPVFESASMAGCLAAAQAGFAVAPVARSQLRDGLRALSAHEGMPGLPPARFYAYARSAEPAAQALVAAVRQTGQRRRFAR